MIHDIFDFNDRALNVKPKDYSGGLSPKEVKFLRTAASEESDELLLASLGVDEEGCSISVKDAIVAQVDALIDQAYFAIGGLARLGLTAEQAQACFDAVHQANMTKKLGIGAGRGDMGVVDAAKPEGWVGPEKRIGEILFPGWRS